MVIRVGYAGGIGVSGLIGLGTGSGVAVPRIRLSSTSVAESVTNPTTIGTLSVVNGSGTYTFTETADPDSKFAVSGSNLNTAATLDYETATTHSVTIQADNGVDTPLSRTFTINVTDVAEGSFDYAFTFGGDFYTFGGDAYTYGAP